jgi:hypothetical protein
MSFSRLVRAVLLSVSAACASERPPDGAKRVEVQQIALDTASRAWNHAAGVDSVRMHGDTAVVWVSPRDWQATDAPQAGVRVTPDGRITAIQWVMGG